MQNRIEARRSLTPTSGRTPLLVYRQNDAHRGAPIICAILGVLENNIAWQAALRVRYGGGSLRPVDCEHRGCTYSAWHPGTVLPTGRNAYGIQIETPATATRSDSVHQSLRAS